MYVKYSVLFIGLYQKYISPRKGFVCAYSTLHDCSSCSSWIKRVINKHGNSGKSLVLAIRRFKNCRDAHSHLIQNNDSDPEKDDNNDKKLKDDVRKLAADACVCTAPCFPF